MINEKRLIKLTRDLIRIDSQNPPGNESKLALFTQKLLKSIGIKSRIYEFKKGRSNLIAMIKGSNSGHSLLLTPHLDTVPVGRSWRIPPFSGKIIKNKLYGLGATDCKCNLAVMLEVLRSISEDKVTLDYDLIIAATADEESGSGLGLIPLIKRGVLKADAALVLDADDFEIVVAQKGLIHLKVKLKGKKAHGAYPWLGINAIELATKIINDLKTEKKNYPADKYLRPPTVNVGTIHGGDKVNVVADWCEFELDFRFLPGMSEKLILKNLKRRIAKYAKDFSIEIQGIQDPYRIDTRHPLVNSLLLAMKDSGVKPRLSGSEGATVITFFQHKNIPAVATGFGVEGCAHMADEFVTLNNLRKGAKVLEGFLKNYK